MPSNRLLLVLAACILPAAHMHAACNIIDGKGYGDCDGVNIRSDSKRSLEVRGQVSESAVVEGATVHAGGSLNLSGISNGDISVRRGGQLTVTGVVNGAIRNDGGSVIIEGIVQRLESNGGSALVGGNLGFVSGSGPVTFKTGSVLAGIPLEQGKRWP